MRHYDSVGRDACNRIARTHRIDSPDPGITCCNAKKYRTSVVVDMTLHCSHRV